MSTLDTPCTRNAALRRSAASWTGRTVDGAVARLAVLEDTSILPAMNDACEIGIGGR